MPGTEPASRAHDREDDFPTGRGQRAGRRSTSRRGGSKDGQETLVDQVIRWGSAESRARDDERQLEAAAWYQPGERRRRRRDAVRSREHADKIARQLPQGALVEVAAGQIHLAWKAMALTLHARQNPLGPALTSSWQRRSDEIAAAAVARPLPARGHWLRNRRPNEIPGLVEELTPEAVRATLSAAAQHLAVVAADDEFLDHQELAADGALVSFVQHRASGLRAVFTVDPEDAPFGKVDSKPYQIGSIDPARPGTCSDWDRYVGLGIGTRIYRHAAALLPHVRWPGGVVSEYSSAVRRKLHAEQPFAWRDSGCRWCDEHLRDWRSATPADFTAHP